MTLARHLSAEPASRVEVATGRAQKSRSKAFDEFGVDSGAFRAWFPEAFARWLHQNFRNPEMVAAAFGVRYQTALNWWQGSNRASGDTVAAVFMSHPAAVSWFLAEWSEK